MTPKQKSHCSIPAVSLVILGLCLPTLSQVPPTVPISGTQFLSGPPCGGAPTATATFVGSTGPIADALPYSGVDFTVTVSGVGSYLWDIDVLTFLPHARCSDVDLTLRSPAGTVVRLTTDNFGTASNVYNGTTWDDSSTNNVTDSSWTNGVATPLFSPEGRLSAFRGEDPNGVWTLNVFDDLFGLVGSLTTWSVTVRTLPTAPLSNTTVFTNSSVMPVPDGSQQNLSTISVSGLDPFLVAPSVLVNVLHTHCQDLDIRLRAPSGNEMKLTTNNGSVQDNVFAGTRFDSDAPLPVTDPLYENLVVVPLVSPEGSFDNLLGENPNGDWQLVVNEDFFNGQGGTLVSWELTLTTLPAPPVPSAPTSNPGTNGPVADFTLAATIFPTTYTTVVSGAGPYLWDVDLFTELTHTFCGDLDVTLTSPAGTSVTITTDNGLSRDNLFNGTRWDDHVIDPVTDHAFTNLVTVPELSPEGRLARFRGENPNGTWTLTVSDDEASNAGSLNAWSIDVVSLVTPPPLTKVTRHFKNLNVHLPLDGGGTWADFVVFPDLGGPVTKVEFAINSPHAAPGSLQIFLMSPSGKRVAVTTNNGGSLTTALEGAFFTPDAAVPVTDFPYAFPLVANPVSPEGGFDPLIGEDPAGLWLIVFEPATSGPGGLVRSWELILHTCSENGRAFCTNGTLASDHTTACPCGNAGAAGHGCAHSFDPNGASLAATGSIATDSVVLEASALPTSAFTLFIQHDAAGDTPFHDGVLCASGNLIRLRGRGAASGMASFPNSLFANDSTLTLSQRGGVAVGSGASRNYGAWYRNASTTFCPPATANVSNGWMIRW